MMQKIWKIRQQDRRLRATLARQLGSTDLFAGILLNRGILTAEDAAYFLNCNLSDLPDPYLLRDMSKAVDRIKRAVERKEKILVYGDYDVDGITGVALLTTVLSKMGADVSFYIPHRIQEGYGLNSEIANFARQKNISLLITIDCGITDAKEIQLLNKIGIETIVTDHHQPHLKLPDAYAIINPKRNNCPYPHKDLSGVGVAFKLANALLAPQELNEHLDLVCLGTVADVVPITGENRILVKHGLNFIKESSKPGLKALIETSRLKGKDMSVDFIGYILAPRLNSSGRIGSPDLAVRLLLSQHFQEARDIAMILEKQNQNRQRIESEVLRQAMIKLEKEVNFSKHRVIVLHEEGWHPGVIGIVASRISERFFRPTIIITLKENEGAGSGRSIRNFHLFGALCECQELLKTFGGHKHAVGLTIPRRNLERFKRAINEIGYRLISKEDLIPVLEIDASISLSLLSEGFFKELQSLEPFGLGNSEPVFCSNGLKLRSQPRVVGRDTLKMWVTDGEVTCEAVGFGMAEFLEVISESKSFNLAYTPSLNNWQGTETVQLQIKDIKVEEFGQTTYVACAP
jgi:single-stranded-DNA-specific exonuclease